MSDNKQKLLMKDYAIEIAQELVRIDLAKLHIKEIKESAKESELDVKVLTKLAARYHANDYEEVKQEAEQFFELYETTFDYNN